MQDRWGYVLDQNHRFGPNTDIIHAEASNDDRAPDPRGKGRRHDSERSHVEVAKLQWARRTFSVRR